MSSLVSVITPAYNAEAYLAETIESVLAQSFEAWELIVIDDGSTDATAQIVKSYADERIRYYFQSNQGVMNARNAGLQLARGEFVTFLDDDDQWKPQFLAITYSALAARKNLAAVYTQARAIDEHGHRLPISVGRMVASDQLYHELCAGGIFPCHSALVRIDIVRAVGSFDTGLADMGLEDWDLWLRIAKTYPIQALPAVQVDYRIHPDNISKKFVNVHACRMAVLAKHFGLPIGEPTIWPADKCRAYGFGYRSSAIDYLMGGDWEYAQELLNQAVNAYPDILIQPETFYELVCGSQPRAQRGQVDQLDIEYNARLMFEWLQTVTASPNQSVMRLRRVAYGQAFWVLAMLSDQAGNWTAARRYLGQAISANPRLMFSSAVFRRWVKLHSGKRLIKLIRLIRSRLLPKAVMGRRAI